ncbi:hypothetical protein Tco_1563178 [Tanacetum coccineum]
MLKVSPWKGVVRFGKRGKLHHRYVGPFKVLEKVRAIAYNLELPQELSRVHNMFHVSNLKKCYADEPLAVPLDGLHIDDKLHFVEELVEIMYREVKQLKRSRIPIVKVRWNSRRGPEFTWEREDQFRKKYPHLFTETAPSSSETNEVQDKGYIGGRWYGYQEKDKNKDKTGQNRARDQKEREKTSPAFVELQNSNSSAQQDALILSVIEQLKTQKEESRNIDREIALEKKIKQLDNIVFKRDQSVQTVHMLTKPQFFYDHTTKQALAIVILDSDETLMLAKRDPNPSERPTKVEVLKELPKVSMVCLRTCLESDE